MEESFVLNLRSNCSPLHARRAVAGEQKKTFQCSYVTQKILRDKCDLESLLTIRSSSPLTRPSTLSVCTVHVPARREGPVAYMYFLSRFAILCMYLRRSARHRSPSNKTERGELVSGVLYSALSDTTIYAAVQCKTDCCCTILVRPIKIVQSAQLYVISSQAELTRHTYQPQ